jgi:hypothetical protein
VVLDYKLKHTNKELEERLTCWRGAPGGLRRGEAGRPGPTGPGSSRPLSVSIFSSAFHAPLLLCDRVIHSVAPPKCSRPLLCLHYCSLHLMILLWVTSMLPCLTSLHDIPAKQSLGCPHACPLHVVWLKLLEGHPLMHHGACKVRSTRLPPSKHVLTLSTLILKNKSKLRAYNEFKYKFIGIFKALKTNVSRKCFLTTFILASPVLLASLWRTDTANQRGGSEWEPIKFFLEGDGNSNKMNAASNTRLQLTTQVGQAHVATGVPLDLGTNT